MSKLISLEALRLERETVLGRGTYGTVFRGTYNDIPVAVKRIELVKLETPTSSTDQDRAEEEVLKRLDHSNVVKLLHCEQDETFL